MSAPSLFWLDANNLFVPPRTFVVPSAIWEDDIAPGQCLWFGFEGENERGLRDDEGCRQDFGLIMDAAISSKRGIPILARRVGQLVRAFRLWNGPPHKLSDWRQLPLGHSMMLSPVPCEKEEDLANFRVRYLVQKGVGEFSVETRSDGSLWVTKAS